MSTAKIWDYSIRWMSKVMYLNHTPEGSISITIPLTYTTEEKAYIYKHLHFLFYYWGVCQDHPKYIRNDIVKPLHILIIYYIKQFEEMHDL